MKTSILALYFHYTEKSLDHSRFIETKNIKKLNINIMWLSQPTLMSFLVNYLIEDTNKYLTWQGQYLNDAGEWLTPLMSFGQMNNGHRPHNAVGIAQRQGQPQHCHHLHPLRCQELQKARFLELALGDYRIESAAKPQLELRQVGALECLQLLEFSEISMRDGTSVEGDAMEIEQLGFLFWG